MYGLDGKAVLITGGAAGIGRSIALRLAHEGCDLGILDVDTTAAERTSAEVEHVGHRAEVFGADVGDADQVRRAVDAFVKAFGKIDMLANNAGVATVGRIEETPLEEWRRVFRINVDGTFNMCKAVIPHMRARKTGRIVNVASWLGKVGKPYYGAYSASKFAVVGLTESLAMELAPAGINVNAVCPGVIMETNMRRFADRESLAHGLPTAREREAQIPLGRLGLPDDVARVVAFLLSPEAVYMTGQSINVTGGLWVH